VWARHIPPVCLMVRSQCATPPTVSIPSTPGPSSKPPNKLALALAFFAIFVVWGTTYLAIRYAVETIPPFVAAAIRHTTAGSILMAMAWVWGFRPRKEHWAAGCVAGALFFLVGHGTLHWAEQYVSSGLAALLIASEPMWILALGVAMGQQRMNLLAVRRDGSPGRARAPLQVREAEVEAGRHHSRIVLRDQGRVRQAQPSAGQPRPYSSRIRWGS
jgi:hypothetical protein